MKKRFSLSVLSMFLFIFSHAQLSGGIRAGGNFTNIIGPESKEYKFKPGFHVGAYLEYDFAEKLSFQTEAVYSVKGFRYKYTTPSTPTPSASFQSVYDVLYSLNYIDIPFLLNINFGQMGSYLGLGPQVSILLSTKTDGEMSTTITYNTTPPTTQSTTVTLPNDNTESFAPVDFGVVIGTGSKFNSGIEYCLRAGYGLTNVFVPKDPLFSHSSSDPFHNLVFTVTLGYAFGKTSGNYVNDKRYKKKRRH